MSITSVAERTKIVTLKTGAFRPIKTHKRETQAENDRHNTQSVKAVRIQLTDHAALNDLAKLHGQAYEFHTKITRPTIEEGMRLLPMTKEMEHAAAMGKFRAQHDKLAAAFLADYDSEKADAPRRLNGLFDASMWPEHDVVTGKFRFETRYLPCPVDGEWAEWLWISVQAAQLDLQEQLEAAIRRVAERCATEGKLYQSVFDNLKELLDLVPDLNLANDPKIKAIAEQAAKLADQDKDAVVNRPQYRKQLAKEADRLLSIFGGGSAAGPSELPQVCECPSLF